MLKFNFRPHHGLCIHFFRGKGYSDQFVENMTNIVKKLEENPTIQLIRGADDLCGSCPNLLEKSICNSQEKVRRFDESVLKYCELAYHSTLSWEEFSALVKGNILDPGLRQEVCGSCQWSEICQ